MVQVLRPLIAAIALTGLGLAAAPAQVHENARWGFSVRSPSGWKRIPIQANERWIVDKFLCKRAYTSEESAVEKPEMRIIVFPHSITKRKTSNPGGDDKEEKKEEKGDGDGDGPDAIRFKTVYRDYRTYLKGTFQGGGYYFTREERDEHAGVSVEKLEAKVEKNAYSGKKRIISWVFYLQDCDVAVDFVVFETAYDDLKRTCQKALKSFKLIKRDPKAAENDPEEWRTVKLESKMTPEERMRHRRDKAEETIRRIEETLPEGWTTSRSAHFFTVSNASKKYTKKIVQQAEAIRNWLDENLSQIGEDYVPTAILRVCKTDDDARAYTRGSGDAWDTVVQEIVVSERSWLSRRQQMEGVATGVCAYWFRKKNEDLVDDLPPWLKLGIRQYVGTGLARGKRLVFKPDSWERDNLREGEREGKLIECQALIKMTDAEYRKALRKGGQALVAQSGSLARYLFSKRARSNKKTKGVVLDYFANLGDIVRVQIAKDKKADKKRKRAENEEEEIELAKRRKEAAKKRARHVVDETFRRTFADWDDGDWKKFESSWRRASL